MPLIDTTTLLRLADRAAYQYWQIDLVSTAIRAQGTNYYWKTVSDTEDVDVEVPLEGPCEIIDDDLLTNSMVKGTYLGNLITAMESHFNRRDANNVPLQLGGWDGYLATKNERVSYYFNLLYVMVKSSEMLAINVFSENDDQFGRVQVATGPVIVFTNGINYGTGSVTNMADGSNYAGTQLKVKVTAMGATNLDLRLAVKDLSNNPTTIDVTVPGGSAAGTIVNVGTSANRFLDVTGVTYVPAGNTGTVGDDVTIRNLKERQIAL